MSDTKSRGRLYIYGERTEILTIQVPASRKEEVKAEFYAVLKKYEDPKNLVLEPKSKLITTIVDVDELVDKMTKESVEHFVVDEMENKGGQFRGLSEPFRKEILEEKYNVEVSVLPKDKKKISTGLYSAGGKFYTNKIVANQLVILEWTSRESAEEYLSNLK